ncbi:MAG TPA: hypothetical protein VFT74_20415, partial [Isosphaeraceae bacterium]|nr:hypothetical protein [Isosphaeraceae bacterium]
GGVFGDKVKALDDLARALGRLSDRARTRLTVENDDRSFSPSDLLPFCRAEGIPLVYDAHHHRCLPDALSIEQATAEALRTWNREPVFHLSSPRDGWSGSEPRPHHDFIDIADLPACWRTLDVTVEVEAKAKEAAVGKLRDELAAVETGKATAKRRRSIRKT